MSPIDGKHIGVDLGTVHGLVAQELADVFQGPPVQQQVDGEGVPKRVRADGKACAPYPLHQGLDMPVHGLPGHGEDPFGFAKVSRIEIALDSILQ